MESNTVENKHIVYEWFRSDEFEMDEVISKIKSMILRRFLKDPNSFDGGDQFIFSCNENNYPIRYMTPYPGRMDYEYLSGNSLFQIDKKSRLHLDRKRLALSEWVPFEI